MAKTEINNAAVVIAGGAKNLGGLVARDLAQTGAKIAIHFHSDETLADAEQTKQAIEQFGSEAIIVQGDLTKSSDVERLFAEAKTAFGKVDIAINTVGKVLRKPIIDTSNEELDAMIDANTKSAYLFLKEAGKEISDNGKIVSIVTSLLGAFTDGYSTYAGSKAAVEHFNRAAAKEFADRGISVTAVAPGPMDTPFFYGEETPERVEYHKSQAIGGQLTKIEDIAPIIRFLVSDGWWITGQTIFANGGYTTR